jgi:hypothetical protein
MKMLFFLLFGLIFELFAFPDEAVLTSVEGRVEVLIPGSIHWAPVQENMRIVHNYRIRTHKGSSCLLVFSEQDKIRMDENSNLLFNTSLHSDGKQLQRIFADLRGSFYFSLNPKDTLLGTDSTIRVYSQLYTPGIKITAHSAEMRLLVVHDSLRWSCQVFKGKALLSSKSFAELMVLPGKAFYSSNRTDPSKGTIVDMDSVQIDTFGRLSKVYPTTNNKSSSTTRHNRIAISPFKPLADSTFGVWQPGVFLAEIATNNLAPGRIGQQLPTYTNHPSEWDDPNSPAEYLLTGELLQFEMQQHKDLWTLTVRAQVRVHSMETGFVLAQESFYKVYKGLQQKGNEFTVLQWLPLDYKNHRISQSILGELARDFAILSQRISDPFAEID